MVVGEDDQVPYFDILEVRLAKNISKSSGIEVVDVRTFFG